MAADRRHVAVVLVALLALLAVAVVVGRFVYEVQPWKDPAQAALAIEHMGPYAAALYIVLVTVAVIIPPVPDTVPVIVAGAQFGAIAGAAYALAGITVGTSVSFHLARRYGRRLLERHLPRAASFRFDSYVARMGWNAVFVGTLIGANSGLVSYAAGVANMRFAAFLSATLLGVLPQIVIVAATGQALRGHMLLMIAGALALMLVTALVSRPAVRILARQRARLRGGQGRESGLRRNTMGDHGTGGIS